MGASKANAVNSPGWHGVQLLIDEAVNLTAWDASLNASAKRRENISVFGKNSPR